MPEFRQFSVSNALSDAEVIKGQRGRNALLNMQVQNAPKEIGYSNALSQQNLDIGQAELGEYKNSLTQRDASQDAQEAFTAAQYVMQSQAPKRMVEEQFPHIIAEFQKQGIDWQSLQDDDVRELADGVMAHYGAQLGQGPPEQPAQFDTMGGPGGSLLQRNQQTGAMTSVLGREPSETGSNSRYGNPQIDADGNVLTLDRSTGQYGQAGMQASANLRLITLPDGSVQAVDMRQPVANGQSPQTAPVVSPETALTGATARAGAEAGARASATATADRQTAQTANERTLEVWRVAREGLVSALGGTDTGPVTGRIPAVTSGQQIAEGAVAAVAPVLKQLFRSAGEGIFTDRDQQLLLDMVPKRVDHPETITAKMQMIDSIIEAKLRTQPQTATSTNASPQTRRVRVDMQGNELAP